MSKNETLNEKLSTLQNQAIELRYFEHEIPSEIDEKIDDILKSNPISSDVVESKNTKILNLYAERMAILTVRTLKLHFAEKAILSLITVYNMSDNRDALLVLSLIYDSLNRIGVNPESVFKKMKNLYPKSDFLIDYIKRSEEDKSIESMGYKAIDTEGKFTYQRTW